MGAHGARGACPSPVGTMHIAGMTTSVCALLLCGVLIGRGAENTLFRHFPLFYSYLIFNFSGSACLFLIYWRFPQIYPSAYWIYYLVSVLVEFTVLVEISDHIFSRVPCNPHSRAGIDHPNLDGAGAFLRLASDHVVLPQKLGVAWVFFARL